MSYTLQLTNGKILLTLADQQIDDVTTSLTLIGKNVNAYGTSLNDNFIRLMENFSNDTAPTNPLVGQIWFDQTAQQIKVYTADLQFKPVGGPILSSTTPVGLVAGDLWIDTTKSQLNYYDGTNLVTVGPDYDSSLGITGVIVTPITDNTGYVNPSSVIYAGGQIIGVISSSTFTPQVNSTQDLVGITTVHPGITLASGSKFYGTATNADSIGNILSSDLLLTTLTDPQTLVGQLGIYNDDGLTIGTNEDLSFYVNTSTRAATLALGNIQDFDFFAKTASNSSVHCLHYSSSTGYIGIFNSTPAYPVDITGNVNINGDLTVLGTSTYITTQVLQVNGPTIELSYGNTSNTIANGGGIVLNGLTNKTFTWNSTLAAWQSSENINLTPGLTYMINGQTVLSATTLGTSVTSAPGLTTLSGLLDITVDKISISSATIGLINSGPLTIGSGATTEVDFSGLVLKNVHTVVPGDGSTSDTVATIGYVQDAISTNISGNFALQLDVTGNAASSSDPATDTFIVNMLNSYLLPPTDPDYTIRPGARARIMVTRTTTTSVTAVSNAIGFNGVAVYTAGTTTPVNVITDDRPYTAVTNITGLPIVINRAVKEYRVNSSNQWQAYPAGSGANNVYTDGTW